MRWSSRRSLPLLPLLLLFAPIPASAQRIREIQVHGLATFAATRFVGGGIGLGIRPPGRLGLLLGASAGAYDRETAGRFEGLAVFRLNPYATSGVHAYGTAGVALLTRRSGSDGYLVLIVGLESRPAGKSGWFLEAGVGGGVRVAAGVRIRRLTQATRR